MDTFAHATQRIALATGPRSWVHLSAQEPVAASTAKLSNARAKIRELESGAGIDAESIGLVQRGRGSSGPKRLYPVIASHARVHAAGSSDAAPRIGTPAAPRALKRSWSIRTAAITSRRAHQFPGMRMLASLVVSGVAPTVAGPEHGALIGTRERVGRALQGMSFELDSFLGRPCDQPGCASSTNPSLSCARRLRSIL